VNNRAELYKSA